jgi:hypothetical protein
VHENAEAELYPIGNEQHCKRGDHYDPTVENPGATCDLPSGRGDGGFVYCPSARQTVHK